MDDIFASELAQAFASQVKIDDGRRAPGKIKHHAGKGLIQWRVGMGKTLDATAIAERLIEGLPKSKGAVFGGMMIIDLEITLAAQDQIEARMLGEADQHMVEKTDAGFDVSLAGPVENKVQLNRGLRRLSAYLGLTGSDDR